jgi:hypothetical protein
MKKPDLLLLIVIWEFLTAFVALIGISAIAAFAFPEAINPFIGPSMLGAIFGLSIAILVLLCYAGLALASGIGILQRKEWGRVLSIVHAALSLLCFPFGTIIGILSTIYLTRPEVTNYVRTVSGEATPAVKLSGF